jgi:uncharacterized membrane protein YkoI
MQTRSSWIILALALAAGLTAGCANAKNEDAGNRFLLAELSEPARAAVQKLIAGGQVEKINKEVERGKTVYDVEATVGGKHVEYLIADVDGAVLGTETQIEFRELPEPVRAAVENLFGMTTGLMIMKGVEYGETSYEIVGEKDGKTIEVTFDPTGKRTE